MAFHPSILIDSLAAFQSANRYWIAFSGGLDSTALLAAAVAMRGQLPGTLIAIHIDHGLHPHSALWAEHCQQYCAQFSIPLIIKKLNLKPRSGDSVEAVSRVARYQAFAELMTQNDVLLTAHHSDDQAETVLLALLRGSGVPGLAAMPFFMPLGNGYLIRPLLSVTHSELMQYVKQQQLNWIEDPTNHLIDFNRNYLRQCVMPVLRTRWPSFNVTFHRTAQHCAEANYLIEKMAAQQLATLGGTRFGTLDIAGLRQLELPLQKAVVRLWLKNAGYRAPSARYLTRICTELLTTRRDAKPLVAWMGCEIRRYRQDLFAMPPLPAPPSAPLWWTVGATPTTLELPLRIGHLHWQPLPQVTPMNQWKLQVRFGGTRMRCQRGAGQTGELKRIYQMHNVPEWWRPFVPLIFIDEELMMVAGVCSCQTQKSLQGIVHFEPGAGVFL